MADKIINSTIDMGRETVSGRTHITVPFQSIRTDAPTPTFVEALKKVSRRRKLPVGENIRDAIRTIKGDGK